MQIIYHITTKKEWENALENGFYEAKSLAIEGFIHCSTIDQVNGVLERYFKDATDIIKLTIDISKLTHKLVFELAPSINEVFPHIYGILNLDAVIETEIVR